MAETSEQHWESIQAKTFTKWINDKLIKGGHRPIVDIYTDLRNGVALGNLLSILLKTPIRFNQNPFTRIQKVENMEVLIKLIKSKGIVLINIGSEDIVDGNRKLILGLIWTLISKLSIAEVYAGDLSVRDELLRWCREVTKTYDNVNINDLSKSWQDGLGFNAIINRFRPDLVQNYWDLKSCERYKNLEQAFEIADKKLGISRLLDVEDVADVIRPDEKSMITYLSQYYQKFNQMEKEEISRNLVKNLLTKLDWSIQYRNFYEIKARNFLKNQKRYIEKKEEIEILIKELCNKIAEAEILNSDLSKDSVELHSLLGNIGTMHQFYNLNPYIPPKDVSINKMEHEYLNFKNMNGYVNLVQRLECKEGLKLNEEIQKINYQVVKHINLDESIANFSSFYQKLLTNKFENKIVNEDYNKIKEVLKEYTENLFNMKEEKEERNNILQKANGLFKANYKNENNAISINNFKTIINKLQLFVDDEILEKLETKGGYIDHKTFMDAIKVISCNLYNYEYIKKAMILVSKGNDNIDIISTNTSNELKNLLQFNGRSNEINIEKLLSEFIKKE